MFHVEHWIHRCSTGLCRRERALQCALPLPRESLYKKAALPLGGALPREALGRIGSRVRAGDALRWVITECIGPFWTDYP
jgi:hypothetical protein